MDPTPSARRIVVSHTGPEAFAPMARAILSKLGYVILAPDELAASADEQGFGAPAIRIVDERSLPEVEEDGFGSIPIVVVAGRHGVTGADGRIAGAVRRPAGVHELYRLFQDILEENPRSTPRIPTHLPVTCCRDGKEWAGTVLSLSESGCLLRSTEPQMLGARFALTVSLPHQGALALEVDVAYQLIPELGLTFHGTSPTDRKRIEEFIHRTLGNA